MRGREPRNAVEDLALRGRNPERFTDKSLAASRSRGDDKKSLSSFRALSIISR